MVGIVLCHLGIIFFFQRNNTLSVPICSFSVPIRSFSVPIRSFSVSIRSLGALFQRINTLISVSIRSPAYQYAHSAYQCAHSGRSSSVSVRSSAYQYAHQRHGDVGVIVTLTASCDVDVVDTPPQRINTPHSVSRRPQRITPSSVRIVKWETFLTRKLLGKKS